MLKIIILYFAPLAVKNKYHYVFCFWNTNISTTDMCRSVIRFLVVIFLFYFNLISNFVIYHTLILHMKTSI
jgi:hypothetical protein